MALRKTAKGKVDKRTTEYKELVERARKARAAKGGNGAGIIALLIISSNMCSNILLFLSEIENFINN